MSNLRNVRLLMAGLVAGLAIAVACVAPSAAPDGGAAGKTDEIAAHACTRWQTIQVPVHRYAADAEGVMTHEPGWEPFSTIKDTDTYSGEDYAVILRRCAE